MNDLNAKEVSDICVACGMCCDGTMFRHGNIKTEEDLININSKGIETIFEREKWVFKQPCKQFDGCCKIYGQERPQVCNNYFCEPLKKFEANELSLGQAENQIKTVLKLKREIIDISNNFEIFNNLNWQQILSKLDEIIINQNPSELKFYGLMILKLSFFKNAKKLLYTSVKQD